MFTGIVEAIGKVHQIVEGKKQTVLVIRAPFKKLKSGSSLAVNGVCLTVVGQEKNFYSFNLLNETKERTNLAFLKKGSSVNLERPLKIGSRVEGHLVQGHVDGIGKIIKITRPGPVSASDQVRGEERSFFVSYPKKLRRFLIEKGSVSLDGISLTIGKITPIGFWIHCIPHTLNSTIASSYQKNQIVNLEVDLVLKHLFF